MMDALVFVPYLMWLPLLTLAWFLLARQSVPAKNHHKSVIVFGMFSTLQVIVAAAAALSADISPTENLTCFLGVYGFFANIAYVALASFVLTFFYCFTWGRGRPEQGLNISWFVTWGFLNALVLLVHFRSVLLCSV